MNKSSYATMPSPFEKWDANHTLVNYDIEEVERTIGDETIKGYECSQILIEGEVSYPKLASALIRTKYSVDDELALLRQAADKPEEFAAYSTFAEECKVKAKEIMGE